MTIRLAIIYLLMAIIAMMISAGIFYLGYNTKARKLRRYQAARIRDADRAD